MKFLVAWAINNRIFANLLMALMVMGGLIAASSITVRQFPDISLGIISITVPYPGATPLEVEEAILEPIEQRVDGLDGVRKITATASTGLGNVLLSLERGVDVQTELQKVRSEIDRITVFPAEAEEPQILEVESREQVMQLIVSGEATLYDLKQIAQGLRTRITEQDAVSQAEVVGAPEYLVEVAISTNTLQALDLSLTDVAAVIGQQSRDLSAGQVDGADRRFALRTLGDRKRAAEFSDIVVLTGERGGQLTLGQIADVRDTLDDTPLQSTLDGEPAVVVTIYRTGDEQAFDVVDAVSNLIDTEIRPQLSDGVAVTVWRDETIELRGRIQLLLKNAAIGIALVLITLTLALDLRVAIWVGAGVFTAFVGSFMLMAVFGVTIDQLSLFGFILAIGIVVDDAIVVGENIYQEHTRGANGTVAARRGATRMIAPVFFSVSTTMVAFTPLLLAPGATGEFIGSVAAVVIFVLILSLMESFFILPHHLSGLRRAAPRWWSPRHLADGARSRVGGALEALANGPVRRMVSVSAHHPAFMAACGLALFIATLGLLIGGHVKFVFFPEIEGAYVTARVELPESTSRDRTEAAADRLGQAADQAANALADKYRLDPADVVIHTLTSLGEDPTAFSPGVASPETGAPANIASAAVKIMDANIRPFSAAEFAAAWREAIGEIPGMRSFSVSSSVVDVGAPVSLQVSATREEDARAAVTRLRAELESTAGVFDVRDDRFRTTDEIRLTLRDSARAYGVTLNGLAREIRAAVYGAEALRIARDREEVQVRVRLPEAERDSLADIAALRVPVGDGFIPLGELAEVERGPAPASVTRINGRRVITIEADVDPSIITGGDVTAQLLTDVAPVLRADYPGLRISLGGEQEEQEQFGAVMGRNMLIALLVIYALLAMAFGSFTQPIVVLLAIPFGFVGAVIGHAILGLNLTLLSMFGIIGLAGVIINTALLMVDFINDARRTGTTLEDAVITGAVNRFRAIVLTTFTTFLGVTPLILERSLQAQFLVPTAVSVGLGILIGGAINMLMIPAFASLHGRLTDGGMVRQTRRRTAPLPSQMPHPQPPTPPPPPQG